ncbi:MAG: ABC transporter ATP-binding protein [Rhodospirillales bacterium]|nr:ABC transporter ATP-binding protein [Rhodospirillales bacterium]
MDATLTAAPIVSLRGLSFAHPGDATGREVLAGLDLDLPRGGFTAIVGPSGVGKSTLLRVIAGLAPPRAGTVSLTARPAADRRPLALVFQDARLMPWRRVAANVAFGLEGLALDASARRARALAALRLVGLETEAGKFPAQLSGGQRQRVGLARSLAVAPDLLLMDEPFSALDAITRHGLQDELLRVWRETGASVLFVTHDLDEAAYLADRVLLLAGSPAHVVRDIAIELPRPRPRAGLGAHVADLRQALEENFIGGAGI